MSVVNKSKTIMINPILSSNDENLLIKTKYISSDNISDEKSFLQYEKLKHNLKKRLREKIMDEFASKITENETKKDIYIFTSLNLNCDSKGIYHRLKKINQNQKQSINESNKLKTCFINWFYKTPNAVVRHRTNNNKKNDRNRMIKINYYRYQNSRYSNIAKKTTDMTTRKKNITIKTQLPLNQKIQIRPKYKYNYSNSNSNISYNKFELGKNDLNKGNIYINKKNGNASYYYKNKYNNFGSLTIIQHNVENSKKYKHNRNGSYVWTINKDLPKTSRNKQKINIIDSQNTLKSSKSSWIIFCNSSYRGKERESAKNQDVN